MAADRIEFSDILFSDVDLKVEPRSLPLGEGGYGLTWRAMYRPKGADDEYLDVVVKVLKVGTNPKPGSDPHKDFMEEIQHLKKLRHQGIVRIIRQGTCQIGDTTTPYYLTEWEEALALDKFLKVAPNSPIPIKFVFAFLRGILEVLAYCHRHGIIHLDIKPDNILARFSDGDRSRDFHSFDHCILIDFGKAKALLSLREHDSNETTVGGGVWDYVHSNLRPYLRKNKVDKKLFALGAAGFDLFAVSAILRKDILPRVATSDKLSRDYEFLVHLADDLQNDTAGTSGFHLFSAEDGLEAIHRYRNNVEPSNKSIRLSASITVGWSSLAREIVRTLEFQRLRNVSQLSLTHLVYPSATHSRFSHSLGAYYMAGKYATALLQEPLFCIKYSQRDIDILQIRALLHDIGHYPMAHYLEELQGAIPGIKLHHTTYGERLRSGDIVCEGMRGQGALVDVLDVAGIRQEVAAKKSGTLMDAIIDGPVDCDKLDYLVRDGLSCGVPYAESIDVDRFLASLTWHRDGPNGPYSLAITPKGIAAAETILTARYLLFAEVYWHKTCRSAVAMIKEAFLLAWQAGLVTQKDLDYHLMTKDDRGVLEWLTQTLAKHSPGVASDLIGNSLIPGGNRAPYKRIATYSHTWAPEITKLFYREIGRTGIDKLFDLKVYLVKELNRHGKVARPGTWVDIQAHHLLIDRPPENKDTLGELHVKYHGNVLGNKSELLSEMSSVVRSLNEAFSQKVCRVRIFCHPSHCDQILDVTHQNARTFLDSAIRGFFSE